jgi:hypothetical protein
MLAPCTVWIDPGLMTGIAVLRGNDGAFMCDEFEFQEAGYEISNLCSGYQGSLAIGWESFTILPDTHKKTRQPEAAEMTGVCRWLAGNYGCQLLSGRHGAQPGDRNLATMAMLKKLDWWVPGKDDAQSAAQHMLAYLMRSGNLPPSERAKLAVNT